MKSAVHQQLKIDQITSSSKENGGPGPGRLSSTGLQLPTWARAMVRYEKEIEEQEERCDTADTADNRDCTPSKSAKNT